MTYTGQDRADDAETDERALIRRTADGDRGAFESLFREYHPRVHRFALRMTRDPCLAEEVVCDTLYAVWTGAKRFRQQSTVSTWILGIAYRRALKSIASSARHTKRSTSDDQVREMADMDPGTNPESTANSELEGRLTEQALAALSPDHRGVLQLVALGHSCADIAGIVGCPENTVKTRTFHARRKLRSLLQESIECH